MAVRNKDELLNALKDILGDRTDESAIGILEDVSDTVDDYESRNGVDVEAMRTDYETKLSDLEATWSKRYRDRFFNNSADALDPTPPGGIAPEPDVGDSSTTEIVDAESITVDDLFD